mgnify:CR=1 FL=1
MFSIPCLIPLKLFILSILKFSLICNAKSNPEPVTESTILGYLNFNLAYPIPSTSPYKDIVNHQIHGTYELARYPGGGGAPTSDLGRGGPSDDGPQDPK